MTDGWRFLCDEMLAGLGRWLRIAGYDTAIAARGCRDRDLVEQAHAEERILLTRARRLIEIRRAGDRTIVLQGNSIDACARELGLRLALDWTFDPLSRCTLCNTRLERADHRLLASLPPRIRALSSKVNVCPCCGRLYWEGSHVRRMRRRLASFAQQGSDRRAD
ncbi:MAG: Mut7-C RNAse domain-containing protein [Hyphomicrobium sp.]